VMGCFWRSRANRVGRKVNNCPGGKNTMPQNSDTTVMNASYFVQI
jgi:hypothetical protein